MLTKTRSTTAPRTKRRAILSQVGGWIVAGFGAVHVVVAPIDYRDIWQRVAGEQWWNTFTLDRASTFEGLQRSEAFWVTMGSFGVPLLALGAYIVWSARRGSRVPAWLGWILLFYAVSAGIVLPASPIWAIALAGAFIVLGDRAPQSVPSR
ncbi:DUF6463 family protein [Phytoactinopolyspora endophytica]|uniref:DUF6463 family protein n=1 Tax=Phytoactinopolyspora endophytica TaxID=1642495 RepID=UPI00101D3316|nr:DUF6463 family protein [Phytoactinopolyspora endophytica]